MQKIAILYDASQAVISTFDLGEYVAPEELRAQIRSIGRIPAERTTTYQKIRVFESEAQHRDLLDEISDPSQRFGSYQNLIQLKEYRFRDFYRDQKSAKH